MTVSLRPTTPVWTGQHYPFKPSDWTGRMCPFNCPLARKTLSFSLFTPLHTTTTIYEWTQCDLHIPLVDGLFCFAWHKVTERTISQATRPPITFVLTLWCINSLPDNSVVRLIVSDIGDVTLNMSEPAVTVSDFAIIYRVYRRHVIIILRI